jgi:hypothetical protein
MMKSFARFLPLGIVIACLLLTWRTGRAVIYSTDHTTLTGMLWQGKLQLMIGDTFRRVDWGTLRFMDVHPAIAEASLEWSGRADGTHLSLAGFAFHHVAVPTTQVRQTEVVVPAYVLVTLAAAPLLLVFRRWWRRQRWIRMGLCGMCGYDLRGSGERCPECGTATCASRRTPTPAGSDPTPQGSA